MISKTRFKMLMGNTFQVSPSGDDSLQFIGVDSQGTIIDVTLSEKRFLGHLAQLIEQYNIGSLVISFGFNAPSDIQMDMIQDIVANKDALGVDLW